MPDAQELVRRIDDSIAHGWDTCAVTHWQLQIKFSGPCTCLPSALQGCQGLCRINAAFLSLLSLLDGLERSQLSTYVILCHWTQFPMRNYSRWDAYICKKIKVESLRAGAVFFCGETFAVGQVNRQDNDVEMHHPKICLLIQSYVYDLIISVYAKYFYIDI